MRTLRTKLIALFAIALGALCVMFALSSSAPPVALVVRGFTAKRWPKDIAQRLGKREYVSVTIEFTNSGKRGVTYWARYDPRFAEYYVLQKTPSGWKEPNAGFICGTGRQECKQCKLEPSQAVMFQAVVDRETPCKVALSYSDGRSPSRLLRRMPQWIARWVPWGKGSSTITTEVIDLRNAVGLIAEPEPFSTTVSEDENIVSLQASAQGGDASAQFRLAGRCWTGTGVEKSLPEAMKWYERAAQNGHAEAAYNLATIHEHGLAGIVNKDKAIEWYQKADKGGHAQAQTALRTLRSE